jgi:1-acyl-sn-glycerol-3-phosphate acyltransferase
MATPSIQVDATTAREGVLEVIRELLEELGSQGALPTLGADANLDRDLGLGSLERVELMSRLEGAFGVRLPDRVITEANTPEDIAGALLAAPGQGAREESVSGARAAMRAQALHQAAQERGVETAETLIDVLRFRARQDAARTHLTISEDDGRTATLTFGELYEAAQRVAAELVRRGVPAGGTVALMLPTSREFFVTFAGTLLAGATPVPIYPPFRADRIEEYASRQSAILNNAEVCLLITFRKAEAVARLLKPQVRPLQAVVDAQKLIEAGDSATPPAPGALPAHLTGRRARKGSDIALLQYTSGSTGNPKGVVLTHANLLANIGAIGKVLNIRSDDVGVSWLPLYHDMGLIGAWFTPLYYGLQLAVMSPLAFLTRPERWLWAFHRYRGTLTAAPNFAYELCVRKVADRDIEGLDLSTWRAALNGAEPVNPETLERFAARFGAYGFRREALMPVYGLAEAALAVTVPPLGRGVRVDRVEREVFTREGRAVPCAVVQGKPARAEESTAILFVSSGPPIPGHEVKIVDERGRQVPDRVEGFLWFRGPSATNGYYRNEKATAELFPAGKEAADGGYLWLDSGDRAYRAEGEIYVTGRVKDIIIKAGRNIYPHEVEELAARAEGVRKGCVVAFGLRDEGAGTERLAVVAESRETDAARRSAIARAITEQVTVGLGLPPDLVEIIPPGNIPKTSSGKLRREETRRVYLEGKLCTAKPPTWVQIARLGTASALRSAWSGLCGGARQVLERLYGVYAAIAFGVWIVPAWALVKLMPNPRAACRFTSAALKVYMAMVGCRIRVVGREHMAGGAKIYVSNHTSYFDVLALMAALGVDYRFVAKMEVHLMPFIGTFMRRMNHYAFDRSDSQARLRQAEEMEETLRRGESVFVFPEGTFTPETGVRPFQLGAFKAAVSTGAPIVPVSLRGTRKFLRDGTYLPRPTSVTITISPPILPPHAGDGAGPALWSDWHALIQLRDAAREAIGRHCGEPVL